MFIDGHFSEYHEFNAGAHRNTPKTLTAPALISHLAFWINGSAARGSGGCCADTVESLIDNFLLSLCRSIRTIDPYVKLLPNVSGVLLLFDTVADSKDFTACDLAAVHLTDRQRDIFQSTDRCVTIKFSWRGLDIAIRCEVHTEFFTLTTFAELNKRRLERRLPPFTAHQDLNECINLTLAYLRANGNKNLDARVSKYLFEDFWERWHSEFTNPLFASGRLQKNSTIFKGVFADFRGVVFSEAAVQFEDRRRFPPVRPKWGEAAKGKLLPFLTGYQSDRLRRYECAVNYLLDGRAMMLSTLAPQLPEAPIDKRIPVRYIVYAHNTNSSGKTVVNRRQLGRLIGLLHNLGTARLAALKDLKALREVGQRLSSIDSLIQTARERVADKNEVAMDAIQKAHDEFNKIISNFGSTAHYSILYRIERARYYIGQFRTEKTRLRILRLEGDQPYDQFIEQRLGAQYDFIDRLGVRYERTAASINMLDSNLIAIKTSKLDRDIQLIQSWGEFILLICLVPYYVSHLAEYLIKGYLLPQAALAFWVIFGFLAFWRKFGQKGLVGASVALLILLVCMAAFSLMDLNCTSYFRFCLKDLHPVP